MLNRKFTHREILPAEMGCGDPVNATVGTPLGDTMLLHLCVDYDEMEIAQWLIDAVFRARTGTIDTSGR